MFFRRLDKLHTCIVNQYVNRAKRRFRFRDPIERGLCSAQIDDEELRLSWPLGSEAPSVSWRRATMVTRAPQRTNSVTSAAPIPEEALLPQHVLPTSGVPMLMMMCRRWPPARSACRGFHQTAC